MPLNQKTLNNFLFKRPTQNDQIRFCLPKENVCVFLQRTDSNINFQLGPRDTLNNADKKFDECCKENCTEDQACASTPTGCECWDVESNVASTFTDQ